MKQFLDDNFLLETKTAEYLYHEHAKKMPIIDYHCHLIPEQIAENKRFDNITQPWLYGDHYKWRAMRTNGVDEKYCTGNASDFEKFQKWAETVPYTLRNPLYHWTHLELKAYFGITDILNKDSAKAIYEQTKEMLQQPNFNVHGLISSQNVELVCTTDDPIDSLEFHDVILAEGASFKVLPAWRPDKAMAVENPMAFNDYLDQLSDVCRMDILTIDDLTDALQMRHDFFHENGCRLSDHGLDTFYADDYTNNEIAVIFKKVRSGKKLDKGEISKFKSAMLFDFAVMDHEKGWVQQYHYGAMRNNNEKKFKLLGPDTGFDSIGVYDVAQAMSKFLSRLDAEDKLTKTILYNLNPSDNEMVATMLGNFQDGITPGKIQWGSGWWFLDQKDGMIRQMNALSSLGLLSRFVGMLTDSRSFLSFPRHEYFRRILCNLLGKDIENGEMPNDLKLVGSMVEDISYNNAKNYFNF